MSVSISPSPCLCDFCYFFFRSLGCIGRILLSFPLLEKLHVANVVWLKLWLATTEIVLLWVLNKPKQGFERQIGKGWGRKESVASSVITGQALSSQTPGTELGGGCWGVRVDSPSHNGCLLLLVGFPVIPQSLQTLEFVCLSAYMVGGVGRLLVSEALVVFESNFLP